ncbi:MAG: hypothetical protein ACR2OE_15945, partial [Thermomicrobiales bacterium]
DDHDIEYRIQQAYRRGQCDAMATAVTTAELADQLGLAQSTLSTLTRTMGIGWTFGRVRVLTPEDVEVINQRLSEDRRRKEFRAS